MKLVSPVLKHVIYPGLAKAGHLRRSAGPGPAVITYHGILPTGYTAIDPALDGGLLRAESFRRQLRLLKARCDIISPEQFLLWCESKQELPPRSVLLTCDDGLLNTLTDMAPILQDLGVPCLFFVTGASLGETRAMLWHEQLYLMFLNVSAAFTLDLPEADISESVHGKRNRRSLWWKLTKRLSHYGADVRWALLGKIRLQLGLAENWDSHWFEDSAIRRRFLVLNRTDLIQLAAMGMSIGAHTISHPMLSQLPAELAWAEISESRRRIEEALAQRVWALAYPFGDPLSGTTREIEMAERAGFACAFLNVGGGFSAEVSLYALPRIHVTAEMTLAEFEAHISGFHGSLQRLLKRGGNKARRIAQAAGAAT